MTLEDDRKRVIEVFTKARPRAVSAEVKYLRAGARGADLGKIGHAAEQPLPLPDALDRRVARLHRRYEKSINACARAADDIERIERELLTRLTVEEAREAAVGDEAKECSNCYIVVERLIKDRCSACAKYLDRHGVERPREMWEAAIYGERMFGDVLDLPVGTGEDPPAERADG